MIVGALRTQVSNLMCAHTAFGVCRDRQKTKNFDVYTLISVNGFLEAKRTHRLLCAQLAAAI